MIDHERVGTNVPILDRRIQDPRIGAREVATTVDAVPDAVDCVGTVGLVTEVIAPTIDSPTTVEAYVCGPDPMMHAAIDEVARCHFLTIDVNR